MALLNYSEFLFNSNRVERAMTTVKTAINTLRLIPQQSTILAAALYNHTGYLCSQKKFQEAKIVCTESLKIYLRELGKTHESSQSCFSVLYQIYEHLELKTEQADLISTWDTFDSSDVKNIKEKEYIQHAETFLKHVKLTDTRSQKENPEANGDNVEAKIDQNEINQNSNENSHSEKQAKSKKKIEFHEFFGDKYYDMERHQEILSESAENAAQKDLEQIAEEEKKNKWTIFNEEQ